ncbi:response regulator [Sutcliffiella sp. NC1]|uniref:response regulator n=1 Tax=Sutcliffiella sp. NC1 TaxID=3004096 RepID=UPI0022DE5B89|nr:response regulator [Sutcliffiella sp. NC1]WBL14592.1 response regulator [Sutcliffiella sp. NC1]
MFNAMIVDDEPVIRFGLKASINWEEEGLNLIGDFPNGEKALEAMENQQVDLLITDIKMPIMDGLTLMREALKRNPSVKVVLVSSYNDFEYVREGLKHGAVDYVLKPTLEPEEFLQLIQKCVELMKKEQVIEEKLHLIDETKAFKNRHRLEQQLKRMLIKHNKLEFSYEGFNSLQSPMMVIYLKMFNPNRVMDQKGKLYISFMLDELQEQFYLQYEEGICIHINETDLVFVIRNDKDEPQKLKGWLQDQTYIPFTIGYDIASNFKELPESIHRSEEACSRRFFHAEEDVFPYLPLEYGQVKRLKGEQLKQFLLPYDKQKVTEFLTEHFQKRELEEVDPTEMKDEACDIITHLFVDKIDVTLLLEKCSILKKTETMQELHHSLLQQLEECETIVANKGDKLHGDNELIDSALEYIHRNYTDELTLQKIADHIHISRNYFSILFKRFLNQNFIDYVIDLRIKKAKELLEHSSLKVYEVAEQSGFGDVKYFSKLFKKTTGLSPGDYRTEQQK